MLLRTSWVVPHVGDADGGLQQGRVDHAVEGELQKHCYPVIAKFRRDQLLCPLAVYAHLRPCQRHKSVNLVIIHVFHQCTAQQGPLRMAHQVVASRKRRRILRDSVADGVRQLRHLRLQCEEGRSIPEALKLNRFRAWHSTTDPSGELVHRSGIGLQAMHQEHRSWRATTLKSACRCDILLDER